MIRASLTDLPPIFDGIEAVCFDAFGTLVQITDKRQALQFKAGRVLFVGDTCRADVEGPRAAGMNAIHVDD